MSQIDDKKRRVLPIWLPSHISVELPEMQSIKAKKEMIAFDSNTASLLEEFKADPSVGVAADLINTAIVEGDDAGFQTALAVLSDSGEIPVTLKKLMVTYGTDGHLDLGGQREIGDLRRRLKYQANDPLAWIDLARAHTIAGNEKSATRSIEVALHLSGRHRWIARVAARYFVHIGQPDRALTILSRNPDAKTDPWLAATTVAISDINGKSPRNWKAISGLLESNIRPMHLAELESAVATIELNAGAAKKAKKLFISSLREPNGNAIAQAQWVDRSFTIGGLVLPAITPQNDTFEARCWDAYYNKKDILAALGLAKMWMKAEPYSRRPGEMITFLAALLDDYEAIELYAKVSMKANPNDSLLELNAIFGRLSRFDPKSNSKEDKEQLLKDRKYLIRFSQKEGRDAFHALANLGLAEYRLGNFEIGRQFYEAASTKLGEIKEFGALINCLIYHGREALIAGCEWAAQVLDQVRSFSERHARYWSPGAEFYLEKLEKIESNPQAWKEILAELPSRSSVIKNDNASDRLKFEVTNSNATIFLPSKPKK